MLQLPQANGIIGQMEQEVSQRTVYDCKKIISRAFKYATDDLEIITENPMLGVTVKRPKSGRREVWTEEQFNFAYDNCSDPQLKLLISLMIALSSRIGECLALTWSDVYDNEDKHEPSYIRVYKQLVYRSEEFIKETNGRGILKVFDQVRSTRLDAKRRAVFHVTKTEKEIEAKTDRIYVAPEVIFMLRDYKLVQNQHKQLAGDSYIDDDLIFAHEDGTHISSQYADDMFSSFYKPLGLPRVDLYSLRHFSITKKLAINGHDYVSLAKDTAHRQLGTIQDYYETPEDSVRIDTAKAIGKFLIRSDESDSESKVTISLEDEDFAKSLRKWLLIQPENRCLSLLLLCTKKIIQTNSGHSTPTVRNTANHPKFGYCTKPLILLYNISDTKYTNHDSLAAIKRKNLSQAKLDYFSFTAQQKAEKPLKTKAFGVIIWRAKGIRTPGLPLGGGTLYPTELLARISNEIVNSEE